MKYVITGGAGNISRPLTENLLAAGHEVTVIARNAEHLQPLVEKGAKAAVGTIEDVEFLKNTFTGADAAYIMFPPQLAAQEGTGAYEQQAVKYAEAIKASGIKYIVTLSSVGAHMQEGCGPVSGLYYAEQALNKLTDVNILHLRPGFFYVNFYGNLPMIKHMNIMGGNYGDASSKMILSHPRDIAEAAAQELINLSFKGHSVRYLASDERTTGEVTKALGSAVGKPELPWVEFTDEQAHGGLVQAGFPEPVVVKYVEMGGAIRSGEMWEDFVSHRPQPFGKTKVEDFAKEFAAAYNAG